MDKTDIGSLTLSELENNMKQLEEKPFRAKQIYGWIHQKLATDFDEMTDLSKSLREKLKENFHLTNVEIEKKISAKEDNTAKYLFSLGKNTIIESVLMSYSFGNSVCVSSQAGCKMGCLFCHSTLDSLERNLTAYEMLAQVYMAQKDIAQRISNVVVMGSGEPLDNYLNTIKFIEILSSKEGLNLGQRHITVSTCGIVPKIYDLADKRFGINLAVSLHAPNDEIRRKIMPVAKSFPMKELFEACDYYVKNTGRRITYEYALIKDVNDSKENADELARKLKGKLCHVNLIPVNNAPEKTFEKPKKGVIEDFAKTLEKYGVVTTIRRELGSGINAACGQLKGAYKKR